jgi:hypothetical protein
MVKSKKQVVSKDLLELADRLWYWARNENTEVEETGYDIDSVLEWLGDKNMLTKKGKKLAHAFWYRYCKEKRRKKR